MNQDEVQKLRSQGKKLEQKLWNGDYDNSMFESLGVLLGWHRASLKYKKRAAHTTLLETGLV